MEKIKSITEAFSTQPKYLHVLDQYIYDNFCDDKPNACKEIKLEDHGSYPDTEMYYVGYNFEGKRIFKYVASAVNVHYEP